MAKNGQLIDEIFFKITILAEICIKCVIFIKKMQNHLSSGGWGLCSQTPTSENWELRLQTHNCFQRLEASPRHNLPLKFSGYAHYLKYTLHEQNKSLAVKGLTKNIFLQIQFPKLHQYFVLITFELNSYSLILN